MLNLKLYWVEAFTDKSFCGNPAAVIVNADELSDEQKQVIAREMNLSETVFISESRVDDAVYVILNEERVNYKK